MMRGGVQWVRRLSWRKRLMLGMLVLWLLTLFGFYWVERPRPPEGEKLAKLLELSPSSSWGKQAEFDRAFPPGSDVRPVLAYLDQTLPDSTRFERLDYSWLPPEWAYWPTQLTGAIQHAVYLKQPSIPVQPDGERQLTWVVEIIHRRGALVEARFNAYAPEEDFLVWARTQDWGETDIEILKERRATIQALQPSLVEVRQLAAQLETGGLMLTDVWSPVLNLPAENQPRDHLKSVFYYYPHNEKIINFRTNGIVFLIIFGPSGNISEVYVDPVRDKYNYDYRKWQPVAVTILMLTLIFGFFCWFRRRFR